MSLMDLCGLLFGWALVKLYRERDGASLRMRAERLRGCRERVLLRSEEDAMVDELQSVLSEEGYVNGEPMYWYLQDEVNLRNTPQSIRGRGLIKAMT